MATKQVSVPPILKDKPILEEGWLGYFHNTDATRLPPNCLTYPSVNCLIPNRDKVVPAPGKTLIGVKYTHDKNWPIIGNKERFATMGGSVVEVRVTMSDDADLKDIIDVLYPDPVTGIFEWYQVTENVNPLSPAVGKLGMRARYWFDDWFDTNLNPALSLNLPRLVGVNGTNQILSWTGGIAPIVSIVPNASISTTAGTTWTGLGFVDPSLGGSGSIVINGAAYAVTGGWNTDTLTMTNTAGISVNDIAFSQIQTDTAPIPFDVCRQNKNYMFYGSWTSRQFFQSNGFGHDSMLEITAVQAVQNDLVIDPSPYTGTGEHVYRVTIDSVAPNTTVFNGQGANALIFDSTGYSASGNNSYKVYIYQATTYTGSTVNDFWYYYLVYKNGIQVGTATILQNVLTGTPLTGPFPVTDGITFQIPPEIIGTLYPMGAGPYTSYTGYLNAADSWQLDIGSYDTFQWQIDGASPVATFVPITGAPQTLSDGLQITFVSKNGHTLGDYWEITADQAVTKAWTNFYYTLPVRKPGEGYIYRLPSNFWTMEPQEEEMYVNTQYGQWSYVSTVLSADLQSETVSLTPLKQTASSRVIFPYMIGHDDNNLVFITTNKKLESIGRREFVQLPQIGYLSQPVELDFQAASFENGSMKYLDKRQYIASPNDVGMMIYDNQEGIKYWQPPYNLPEIGILSIIDDSLIAHSNLRDQTFSLFTGQSDNGAAYTVRMRMPYNSYGDRWQKKNSSNSFVEGHIQGVPPLILSVYLGVNGCGGIYSHLVEPITCVADDSAPFGQGEHGSHSFGNDIFTSDKPHFNEIYKKFNPILEYYFAAPEIECTTMNHSYEILSLGLNAIDCLIGNTSLVPEEFISPD